MKLILLTDDNEVIAEKLEELLRKENYRVDGMTWNGLCVVVANRKETKLLVETELFHQAVLQMYQQSHTVVENLLEFDGICMDLLKHEVTVHQQLIKLTKTEYAILKLFLEYPVQVLQKKTLLEKIRNYTPDGVENSLKVHISNLRKKLKEATGKEYIETVRGVGFIFSSQTTTT